MILFIFFVVIVLILYTYSNVFRSFIENPSLFFRYAPKDIYFHFSRYKDIPKKPFMNVYVGLFGSGKTLSAVHDAIAFYHRYNDKIVYDDRINDFVTQKVFILSNVHLFGVPYRKFHSMQQLVNISRWRHITDKKKKVRTVTIVIGDEFSICMNSRSFKTNLDPLALSAILTSRHCLVHGFFLTSQRFEHMDALLRQVSTNVIECRKIWRVEVNNYYDAYEREHTSRPEDQVPFLRTGFFVRDQDYHSYDTLQVVEDLAKSCTSGDRLPESEIRANLGTRDLHSAPEKKRKFFKRNK